MKNIFLFIQDQLLGMSWLNDFYGFILELFGLNLEHRIPHILQFFLFDVTKITLLLVTLIYIISYIQSFFPPERTKRILGKYKGIVANTLGALLGTITPFCSCSSIPLFIGFTSAGLPIGVTFSFLISSPLVDLAALVLLISIFGYKIAIVYVIVGLVLAVLGGSLIDRFKMEKYLEDLATQGRNVQKEEHVLSRKERSDFALEQVISTLKKVFIYIVVGVAIGSFIHNLPEAETLVPRVLGKDNNFSVVLATFLGTPMYADIFGTIPIAEALFTKGAGLGTILSFMMSVTALSLPSLIMLKKVVKMPLLLTFTGLVMTGIILIGYGFNALQFLFI